MRTIFSDNKYFEITNSVNSEGGNLYKTNPDSFLEKTLQCALESRKSFESLPKDCPYRFNKIEKIPEEARIILEDNNMTKNEKKKILRDIIQKKLNK